MINYLLRKQGTSTSIGRSNGSLVFIVTFKIISNPLTRAEVVCQLLEGFWHSKNSTSRINTLTSTDKHHKPTKSTMYN